MLYKKIHRQYVREFKEFWEEVKGLYSKPYIKNMGYSTISISVVVDHGICYSYWDLIDTKGKIHLNGGQKKVKWRRCSKDRDDEDRNNKGRLGCYIKRFTDSFLEILAKMIKRLSIVNRI